MGLRLKLVFAVFLLLQLLDFSRGNNVGVAYGRDATNLPSPDRVTQPYNLKFPRKLTNPNGNSWCVASKQAQKSDLQNSLDWVCGPGQADCSAIQPGKQCFEPNDLVSHASFAFNDYYKKHGGTAEACNFGGTGVQVNKDPSHDKCIYS
ncbi:hypothetical protein V6N13_138743 [Hibiscus sabdariffa]|uniref:X8 domain-containing protein n=1 Tax=Hibiscus sabdariffa TaxID=183260 RepID=A0ABR2PJR7_9ROSI